MTTHSIRFQRHGESRSFSDGAPSGLIPDGGQPDVLALIGSEAGLALTSIDSSAWSAVLVEIGTECLGVWTGESRGLEGSNVLGFNRYRLGNRAPSDLIELVKQPGTSTEAIQAAREALEGSGFKTAICNDAAGRIVDRLVRPYFNTALQALDEQLATADDLDLTVSLGLGYPEGPIKLLEESGLAAHFEISQSLYEAYGEPSLLPSRRARVAWTRAESES
jgi:3-hydroxybutyryl-CoA dehydrogenase